MMKKVNGDLAENHYRTTDHDTGELINLTPEYCDMSRKPGIGHNYYERYKTDFYRREQSYVIIRGKKTKPPRYYDKLHKKQSPEHHVIIQKNRTLTALANAHNNTPERRRAKDAIQKQRTKTLNQKL